MGGGSSSLQPLRGYEQRVYQYIRTATRKNHGNGNGNPANGINQLMDDILWIIIAYAKTDTIVVFGTHSIFFPILHFTSFEVPDGYDNNNRWL
jgi:hypothetical protein